MSRTPRCPLCQDPLGTRAPRTCPVCETSHHDDCWEYHGGCTTFACPGVRGWTLGELRLDCASTGDFWCRGAILDASDVFLTIFRGFGGLVRDRLSTMRLATLGARVLLRPRVAHGVAEAFELFLRVPGEEPQKLVEVPGRARQDVEAFGHRLAYALATPLERARAVPATAGGR